MEGANAEEFEPKVCSLCKDLVMYCDCTYEEKSRQRLEAFESKHSQEHDKQSEE